MTQEHREPHQNIYRSRRKMMLDNFLGGISWSLGAVIGGALILAILGFIVSKVNVVPVVGDFVGQVVQFVESNQPANIQNLDKKNNQ